MSPGSRRALLAVVALLALAATVAVGSALAGTGAVQTQTEGDLENGTSTVIKVSLQSDGDARWSVTEHFNVSEPVDRDAFDEIATRFEDGEGRQLGLSAFREARARVAPTVDRSMQIQGIDRTASVENGTLRMSFTWENFARMDGNTFIVDDVFTTEQGTWFDGLTPNQTFIVELPEGSVLDTPKAVDDSTIRWEGPTTFEPGYLEISYAGNGGGLPTIVWLLALALVLTIVGVTGAYLLSRRKGGLGVPDVPIGSGSESDGSAESPGPETTTAAGADDPDADEPDDVDDAATADDGVDLSLLSDEERVEYLIEQNGGRMKQANIVKETGWSNAKVSQLLSAMEEDGRIQKLRIGRENLISFPDEDIGEFEDS